ncbi:hypothetical protein E2C01_088869 [Portunus trituberculatus]|uniref:Uncharacterized protein n=1 Tax=Portunus trituberculatus TaxID=210409 RepID=A0A5B7JFT6_PORTR|nr:hypothetical protein [Portunus trituberculatus]
MTSIKKIPNVLGTRRSNTLDQEREQFEKAQVWGAGTGYIGRQCAKPPAQLPRDLRQVACHMLGACGAACSCCEWCKMAGGLLPVAGSCVVQERQEVLSPPVTAETWPVSGSEV